MEQKKCSFVLHILICARKQIIFLTQYCACCVILSIHQGTGGALIIRKAPSHKGTFQSICALSCGKCSQRLLLFKEIQGRSLICGMDLPCTSFFSFSPCTGVSHCKGNLHYLQLQLSTWRPPLLYPKFINPLQLACFQQGPQSRLKINTV